MGAEAAGAAAARRRVARRGVAAWLALAVVAASPRGDRAGRGSRGGRRECSRRCCCARRSRSSRSSSVAARAGVPLRLHAARRADAGLGHRARTWPRSRRSLALAPAGPPLPGPARGRGVRPELPRLRRPRAGWAWRWDGAPRQRAEVPAAGGGARPLADVRRRGRERGRWRSCRDAAARRSRWPRRPRALGRESWAMARRPRRAARPGRDAIRRDADHAADDPRQGRRRLLRARARAVAAARAGAARRPGHQPRARRAGARRGERALLVRARRAAGGGALPAGARRDGPPGARGGARASASRSCRPSSSTSTSSTRRCSGRWCWPWPSGRSRSGPSGLRRHPWLFGALLATLPWLHQKFLPVWGVLLADGAPSSAGAARAARASWTARAGSGPRACSCRTLVSLYLIALYNFAITGSVRPDALFLAWGPGGVTSARVGQGVLGLLLDARYGILPYVPLLLLAAARARRSAARGASRWCCRRPPSTT